MADPFFITTAISYPNGRPHIGHAYEAIATDAIARFHRQQGRDVFFMTGTDEHGMKMAQAARSRGVEPRALARSEEHTSELQSLMRISYAVFCLKKKHDNNLDRQHTPQHIKDSGQLNIISSTS